MSYVTSLPETTVHLRLSFFTATHKTLRSCCRAHDSPHCRRATDARKRFLRCHGFRTYMRPSIRSGRVHRPPRTGARLVDDTATGNFPDGVPARNYDDEYAPRNRRGACRHGDSQTGRRRLQSGCRCDIHRLRHRGGIINRHPQDLGRTGADESRRRETEANREIRRTTGGR